MSTVSVSKGVFAFKRQHGLSSDKSCKKRRPSAKVKSTVPNWPGDDESTSPLQEENYLKCWDSVSQTLQGLEKNIHETVFRELVEFVSNQTLRCGKQFNEDSLDDGSIPAAVLVMGVNMPDSSMVLSSLDHLLKKNNVASHVVSLNSRNCGTLRQCITHLADQLINGSSSAAEEESCDDSSYSSSSSSSDEEDDLAEEKTTPKKSKSHSGTVKRSCLNMNVLEAWYKEQKQESPGSDDGKIVVMVEDVESFPTSVLEDFIQVVSTHLVPLVLVLCVATSAAALHARLSQPILARLSLTSFRAQPSHSYLATLVQEVLMDGAVSSMRLGGRALRLLLDMFLYHHFSVKIFIQGLKYCMLEHFLSTPASVICCPAEDRRRVLNSLTAAQLNDIRKLPSFRSYTDKLPIIDQVPLLIDDKHFKDWVVTQLQVLDDHHHNLVRVLRLLHPFASTTPHAPLGRQLWSLLALSLNGQLVEGMGDVLNHLSSVPRDQLISPLPLAILALCGATHPSLVAAADMLQELLDELLNMDDLDKTTTPDSPPTSGGAAPLLPSDRFKLKEKLQEMAKKKQAKPSKYAVVRSKVVEIIDCLVKEFCVVPSTLALHEAVYFDDAGVVSSGLMGKHRAAINKALTNPAAYLHCECCKDSKDWNSPSLPDLSIVYRLHLECGRLINLYDWLQAFCACVQVRKNNLIEVKNNAPEDTDEDVNKNTPKKRKNAAVKKSQENDDGVTPQLQARFVQAVSELQLLGFVKTSRRKTDHVARLTWGGY